MHRGGKLYIEYSDFSLSLEQEIIYENNSLSNAGLSNAASMLYFPGALLYSAGFNVNQNLKKKYF
jgi:hypothetical protein